MSGWAKATLVENTLVSTGLHQLALEVPTTVAQAFHAPGQYHRVRVRAAEATFAIASAPGATRFEYLVRTGDGVSADWAQLPLGAEVEVSEPEGPGFPLRDAHGRTLLLVGTGTGFAPLRSVLQQVVRERHLFGEVWAVQGVRFAGQVPWRAERAQWEAAGIGVITTMSGEVRVGPEKTGKVQQRIEELSLDWSHLVAFLCGQERMTQDVTSLLVARGVSKDLVFLNF